MNAVSDDIGRSFPNTPDGSPHPDFSYRGELDGVRAIAVIMVLLVHCVILPADGFIAWVFRHTLSNGWIGVDLFFVLSGYLITSILLKEKNSENYILNFYARRFLRIFPAYYGFLIVLWLFAPNFGIGFMEPAWPLFTYTSNWVKVFQGGEWGPMGHAWSLAVEEQFYLIFPFVVLVLEAKALRRLLIIVIVCSPFVRLGFWLLGIQGATYFLTICRLDVLAMGAYLAIIFFEGKSLCLSQIKRYRLIFLLFLSISTLLWITKELDFKKWFFNLVGLTVVDLTLACFLLLVLAVGFPGLNSLLSKRLLRNIGRISYGIYLFHLPVLQVIDPMVARNLGGSWARTGVTAAASISLTLIIAITSWKFFESPILRLKSRFVAAS